VSNAVIAPELQPWSEIPNWAALEFMKRFPETYFWDDDFTNPRKMSEVTAIGFLRESETLIYVSFFLDWIIDSEFVRLRYMMSLMKKPQFA
jgi:hypothetical protein